MEIIRQCIPDIRPGDWKKQTP